MDFWFEIYVLFKGLLLQINFILVNIYSCFFYIFVLSLFHPVMLWSDTESVCLCLVLCLFCWFFGLDASPQTDSWQGQILFLPHYWSCSFHSSTAISRLTMSEVRLHIRLFFSSSFLHIIQECMHVQFLPLFRQLPTSFRGLILLH